MSRSPTEVAFDALRDVYSEAEPPLDFDDVLENPDEYGEEWYLDHYIDPEREREIVEKHCDEAGLTRRERAAVAFTAITHLGPSTVPPENRGE